MEMPYGRYEMTHAERWAKTLEDYKYSLPEDMIGLVQEFFNRLDHEEESEGGNVFRPTTIGSCRLLENDKVNILLTKMRDLSKNA